MLDDLSMHGGIWWLHHCHGNWHQISKHYVNV